MAMLELNDLLPPSFREEYWTFCGHEHAGLPLDTHYVVFEAYCDNVACDCKKLVASVCEIGADGEHIEEALAYIDYDWSSTKTRCLPSLAEGSPHTPLALQLLEAYKALVHSSEYSERIKRQYAQLKSLSLLATIQKTLPIRNTEKSIGRNELCNCGSGKKFKKCCLQKGSLENAVLSQVT